jgi:hypothetical protein
MICLFICRNLQKQLAQVEEEKKSLSVAHTKLKEEYEDGQRIDPLCFII